MRWRAICSANGMTALVNLNLAACYVYSRPITIGAINANKTTKCPPINKTLSKLPFLDKLSSLSDLYSAFSINTINLKELLMVLFLIS